MRAHAHAHIHTIIRDRRTNGDEQDGQRNRMRDISWIHIHRIPCTVEGCRGLEVKFRTRATRRLVKMLVEILGAERFSDNWWLAIKMNGPTLSLSPFSFVAPPFPSSSRSTARERRPEVHNTFLVLERSLTCHSLLSSLVLRNSDDLLASCHRLFPLDKEASFNRATRPSGSLSFSSTRSRSFLYESTPGNLNCL